MQIVEVKQPSWDSELLWVELEVGNICNYKCWYCFDGYNNGSIKWPDYDLFLDRVSHLIEYYKQNTDKKKIAVHLLGGEITYWKRFNDLTRDLKEKFNCLVVLTTNGSKDVEWWKTSCQNLDRVHISVHHEYAKPSHIADVADIIHEHGVYVEANVFMDPKEWDKCELIAERLKDSRHSWAINYREITYHFDRYYTEYQDNALRNSIPRKSNDPLVYPLSNDCPTTIIDSFGNEHPLGYKELLARRIIKFKDWECNVGVDWLAVHANGDISGICRNGLYDNLAVYNLFDDNFKEKFKPNIVPARCVMDKCWCMFEVNMPKKVIPIYKL